ncbi:MAG: FtsW/RodA/SpoVE family cell cycle protein [Lachnospiraceae bacterium]|nr:FtsW/RodA/SpoVE family cell cycle protein [Lachnospiraceae bacterium]
MEHLIVQLSRYVITLFLIVYTFYCYRAFAGKNKNRQNQIFRAQRILTILIHLLCSTILLLEYQSIKVVTMYALELAFYLISIKLYETFYKGLSKLVLNNMLLCMMIGFIMLGRLSYNLAFRQFLLAAAGMGICLFVPVIIHKLGSFLERLGWQYAIVGILLLMLVFFIGVSKYGAKNWIKIGSFEVQPSEFVKIIYVFFIAALLSKCKSFKHVVMVSAVAAVHVMILVVEKDLGAALIYFITYIVVLFVATTKIAYLALGFIGGAGASVIAYKLFSHVRVRVLAWQDPWSRIDKEGYQITQSLFAIGTGSWFGLGLCRGLPSNVPVVESDFIFSAIAEELGAIFAICLILVYMSNYIMFVNIAMKMKNEFYKLTAFGLGVVFIFQVLLCIGGATKFIPSTGVTLPLISYGGSSIVSMIIVFSIIQGMYVLNGKEESQLEKEEENGAAGDKRRKAAKKKK